PKVTAQVPPKPSPSTSISTRYSPGAAKRRPTPNPPPFLPLPPLASASIFNSLLPSPSGGRVVSHVVLFRPTLLAAVHLLSVLPSMSLTSKVIFFAGSV